MLILTSESMSTSLLWPILGATAAALLLRSWYFRVVFKASCQVRSLTGEYVPGQKPKMLLGNIPDVYRAKNRLDAYNAFHRNLGEIVQIFWLWRHQISVSNYQMARQVLMANQKNYQKFRPNSLLQQLFGHSVLTSEGKDWQRQRLLMNEVFSKNHIKSFHNVFIDYAKKLVHKWNQAIEQAGEPVRLNVCPDLTALFLDIIGKAAIGKDFSALDGEVDDFLEALKYIEAQSSQPWHQFLRWWKHLPLPSNRKLKQAFDQIDNFLSKAVHQEQARSETSSSNALEPNILDLLLRATEALNPNVEPLSEKEVRDNLLAIIVNGHETVTTTVAFSLYLLAQHPEKMALAQAEVDGIIHQGGGTLTKEGISELHYLHGVVLEVLRFSPAVAGLQRIGKEGDTLESWSTPPQQVVGITLEPLHRDSNYFGDLPDQFHPERYLSPESYLHGDGKFPSSQNKCPLSKLWARCPKEIGRHGQVMGIQKPLTFGDGARKCLGEHFAMYEMKLVLAMLLYHFNFKVAPDFEAELELGKFGLFLSAFPKYGVEMMIGSRSH